MVYITEIRLSGGSDSQHITHVKWIQPSQGRAGTATRAEMVQYIRGGSPVSVADGFRNVEVQVVDADPPHIRTVADGRETNNLLELPRF
ncbi:MAG: DUF3892 domain-containing protein [Nannocystaceae bacterium]|nr:DUF3892 domain-containing protein [bacterium]